MELVATCVSDQDMVSPTFCLPTGYCATWQVQYPDNRGVDYWWHCAEPVIIPRRARVDEIDYNKMMFMKILRTLKNVRMKSIGNMVQLLSALEVDPVFGMLEEMFVPWNPKGLRRSRHERRKDLLRVLVRAWYFAPNSAVVYCHLCNLWLNVGQLPE